MNRHLSFAVLLALLLCPLFVAVAARAQATKPSGDFFTIVALPDTQYYTELEAKSEQYFKGQTHWIVENRDKEHIAFVSQLGDIQQDGNFLRMDDHQFDPEALKVMATTKPSDHPINIFQWRRADAAMKILDDADVPYVAVAGNHDYIHWDRKGLPEYYLKFFGPQRFAGKSWYGGASPESPKSPAGMNSFQIFSAGGYKFLSIGLQFAPDNWDLAWAQKVIDNNPSLPTIITTHSYLSKNGVEKDRRSIWEKLVRINPQLFLTLNGHISGANFITEKDDAGLDVLEMLVDYQDYPKPYMGGEGFLRLLRFCLDKNQVEVRSFSPVTHKFFEDPKNQFTIKCDFADRFAPRTKVATTRAAAADAVSSHN